MNWSWIPGVICGEFRLGAPFSKRKRYSEKLERLEPSCEGADWETYRVGKEEARVRVYEGKLVGVECVRSLIYDDREILGLSKRALSRVLGTVPRRKKKWADNSEMLEVPELGLTLWLEDGCVESATVEEIIEPFPGTPLGARSKTRQAVRVPGKRTSRKKTASTSKPR